MISEHEYVAPLDICWCGNTIFRRGNSVCGVCVENGLDGPPDGRLEEFVQAEARQPLAQLQFRAAMLERDILNAADDPAKASALARRRSGLWDAIRELSGERDSPVRPVNPIVEIIHL